MRLGAKTMLWTCCAGPTVAAMVMAGATTANASVTTPGSHVTASQGPNGPGNGPGGGVPWGGGGNDDGHGHGRPACDRWEPQRWNLNGDNTVTAVYQYHDFTYAVSFDQDGSCLNGTLTDTYLPPGEQKMRITGTVDGREITFSVTYPTNYWGTRTFRGRIYWDGEVSGKWFETGTENGSGTWTLGTNAKPACTWWGWFRSQWHECFVRG